MRRTNRRKGISRRKVSRAKLKLRAKAKPRRPRAKPPFKPFLRPTASEFLHFQPVAHPIRPESPSELPFSYGETKLVLLVRDPYWAYSYWDFSGKTWNWVQQKLAEDPSLKPVIRIHDLDAKRHFDLSISLETKNWYLHLGTPDHRYVAELGLGDWNSRFYLIARSNEIRTPRDSPSETVDREWAPKDFEEIYRLSGGGKPGLSSPGSYFLPRST